jgi:hypothetical protein
MAARTELTDSTALLDDGDGLRARIREDGYVLLRGVLDRETVSALGRRGLGVLQTAGWTQSGRDPVTARPRLPVRAVATRDAFSDPALRRIVLDPALHALAFSSSMNGLMHRIMGPGAFCYPLKVPRVVYPSSLVPAHRGNFMHKDFRTTPDVFTCWVPLGDIPTTLGGLAVLPGSQSTRVEPRPLLRLESGWRTTEYAAGDVVVLHCMTTHASLPNVEHRLRFSAEYRWQLADRPAPRRMVVGPLGTELGARVFRHAPWWRPVPPGLKLVDDEGEFRDGLGTVPDSRFVFVTAARGDGAPGFGPGPGSAPHRATGMQGAHTADATAAAHAVAHEAFENRRRGFGGGGIHRLAARARALARGRLDLP